jgi:hypothetical protein
MLQFSTEYYPLRGGGGGCAEMIGKNWPKFEYDFIQLGPVMLNVSAAFPRPVHKTNTRIVVCCKGTNSVTVILLVGTGAVYSMVTLY